MGGAQMLPKIVFLISVSFILAQLLKALEEEEDHNVRLHKYIEGLLVAIIDKHPDILEKR